MSFINPDPKELDEMYQAEEKEDRQKHDEKIQEVEACKICDNNCGFCKYDCNCATLVKVL